MSNRIRISVPKAIWSDPQRYDKWCWETYGRYLKPNHNSTQCELDLDIQLRWF